MTEELKWKTHYVTDPSKFEATLYIARRGESGAVDVVRPFTIERHHMNTQGIAGVAGPTMRGDEGDVRDFLQAVMDCAWSIGLRPQHYEEMKLPMLLLEEHINDFRKLLGIAEGNSTDGTRRSLRDAILSKAGTR